MLLTDPFFLELSAFCKQHQLGVETLIHEAGLQVDVHAVGDRGVDAVLDAFRKAVGPDIRLQTLARGINVVALEQQPADMIDLHAKMFKKHGMTTIRNFDALNDVEQMRPAIEAVRAVAPSGAVPATSSPGRSDTPGGGG